ncbi:hypothetical protein C0Q70_05709 [Pomacea canaliculata]|uniref:Coiled-coil domain-containing protein 138 n=1 Tax=Pomacea canaliculata TaxID=400727 RepID=A0A2T7PLY6_POMCA|nr:hypothetical protein C0Q70_05709 [Pomacea canaliculata]
MDLLDYPSDLDETVTPIMGSPLPSHGQVLESDSPDCSPEPVQRPYHNRTRKVKGGRRKKAEVSFSLGGNRLLYEREQKLKERERMLSISQSNLQTITDHQARQQVAAVQQDYLNQIAHLEQALKEKTKENKRLKENFETMKQANDTLKKEIGLLQNESEKLAKQHNSVQARLSNLQKKQEFEQRQRDGEVNAHQLSVEPRVVKNSKDTEEKKNKQQQKTKASNSPVYDIMSVLLEWVCDAHLRQSITDQPTHPSEKFCAPEFLQDKILKVLPSFVDILRETHLTSVKRSLPCLQFIYWSLLLIEQGNSQQKASLSSTLRRLGEEIYRPRWLRLTDDSAAGIAIAGRMLEPGETVGSEAPKDGLFLCSHNQHIRLLSCLIILKTLSQADVIAHAFEVLKVELKSEVAKELFLYYQATQVIIHYLKPVNKVFMGTAVDILLQMSTDSPFQAAFLESCSTEAFFRTVAMVIRTPVSDARIMERLSIILQKLSKIKSNKKYFEVYTIVTIIQELLRNCGNENAFLALNLKSILFNLNSAS